MGCIVNIISNQICMVGIDMLYFLFFVVSSFALTLFNTSLNAGYEFDYIFDWTVLKYQQGQRTKTQPLVSVSNLPIYSV